MLGWFYRESRAHGKLLLFCFLLVPVVQYFRVVQPWFFEEAVDLAVSPDNLEEILWLGQLFLFVMIAGQSLQYVQSFYLAKAAVHILASLRQRLYDHLVRLPYSHFQKVKSGQMVVRLMNDVDAVGGVLSGSLIRLLSDGFAVIGIVGMMFYINFRLAVLVLLTLPFLMWLTAWLGKKVRRGYLKTKSIISEIATYFTESLAGLETIKAFRKENDVLEDFRNLSRDYTEAYHKLNLLEPSYYAMVEFLSSFLLAMILFDGGMQLNRSQLSFGELVAFISCVHRLMAPVRHLSGFFSEVLNAWTSMRRIYEVLQIQPEEELAALPARTPKGTDLVFDRVSFDYGDGVEVLKQVSFVIRDGEKLALVGRTGSGKSTIIKLLNRFYRPTDGVIRMGGVNLDQIPRDELRSRIGFVLQDVYLFQGDLEGNLSLFSARRHEASLHYLDDVFAQDLMEGKEHDSPIEPSGQNLSTGERQLVAFGRVFQKSAEVFLLDEATSNIDMQTEDFIQKRLETFMEGRTALIIAHRLATIRNVDRILVLKSGRIVENGSYAELIEKRGEFYEYFRHQYKELQDEAAYLPSFSQQEGLSRSSAT